MELTDILQIVSDEMRAVEVELENNIQSSIPLVSDISKYLLGSGGKRIRPAILFLSCGACGLTNGDKRILAAASIELIHTATLLHDDVVDDALLRRGQRSSNVVWGNKPTVLVGDFMLAKALCLMQSCGNLELIKAITEASAKLAEGQVLEVMNGLNMVDFTKELCFDIIEYKTASLIESCGKVGAILADKPDDAISSIGEFGKNIGIAFQLIDDALDYGSTDGALGKKAGQDLLEGKMTLPLFFSLEGATPKTKERIVQLLKKEKPLPSDIERIRTFVKKHNGVEMTRDAAKVYVRKAKKSIHSFPKNDYTKSLNALADYFIERPS